MKKEKKTLSERLNSMNSDKIVAILMGGLFVGGITVGVIYGKDLGYAKGLNEFRKMHTDIVKTIIDECGHEGAFTALKHIRDNKDAYETLLKSPDDVIEAVGELYYKSEYVQKLLKSVED